MYAQRKFSEAINLLDEAISLVEETGNNSALLHRLFNTKGVVNLKTKQYHLALTSFLLAKQHAHTQPSHVKSRLYNDIAFIYTRLNNNYSAIKYFKLTLSLLESKPSISQQTDTLLESDELFPTKARVLLDISRSYKKAGAFREALTFGNRALTDAKSTNNEEFTLKSLVHLSSIYRRLSSYENAIELAVDALQIYKKNNDLSGIASSHNAIGLIYNRLNAHEKAKTYFEKVTSQPKNKIQPKYYAAALRDLALYHLYQHEYSEALALNEQAYQLYEQINDLKGKATVKKNEGMIYQAMGNVELAFQAFTLGFENSKETGNAWEQASNLVNIALLYAQEQPKNTQLWADKALRIAQRIQAKSIIEQAYFALASAEERMSNYKQALLYTKLQTRTLNEIKNDTINMHTNEINALQSMMDNLNQVDILKEEVSVLYGKLFKQDEIISDLNNQADQSNTLIQNLQILLFILMCSVVLLIFKLKKVIKGAAND
jgi:tetratricopeptide (TPR) repeat protein